MRTGGNRSWLSILAIVGGTIVASCGGGPSSLSDLKSRPELGIHPQNARFISHNEHGDEQTIDGTLTAIVGDVFATNDDTDHIFEFYAAELSQRGYVEDDGDLANIRTTVEETVRVWRNGETVARVAIYRKDDPQLPALPSDMPNGTLFEMALTKAYSARPS